MPDISSGETPTPESQTDPLKLSWISWKSNHLKHTAKFAAKPRNHNRPMPDIVSSGTSPPDAPKMANQKLS